MGDATGGGSGLIADGRAALARRDWPAVHKLLAQADPADLTAADLEGLADAAIAMADWDDSLVFRTRAHAAYVAAGDQVGAAWTATRIAMDYAISDDLAQFGGWYATAGELLAEVPEGSAHALLPFPDYHVLLRAGDLDGALEKAELMRETARRVGDRDLELVGLQLAGQAHVRRGEKAEGMRMIDQAMVAAVSGQVGPFAFGQIVCQTLTACQQIGDHGRAFEWLESVERASVVHGMEMSFDCSIHRAGLMKLQGSWARAEALARDGCAGHPNDHHAGWGWCEIGEIHLRMGDLQGAEEAFGIAYEKGYVPHPGLALLRLAQGDTRAASEDIERAFDAAGGDLAVRAQLLEARVVIALAAGDPERARSSADELARVAAECESLTFAAAAKLADGRVRLAEGDAAGAAGALEDGVGELLELGLPYETAVARMDLARARLALGDRSRAVMDLRSAQSAFDQLGAALDGSRVNDLLAELDQPAAASEPTIVDKAFMFTDIERSTLLLEALGDRAWDDLLQWHDRTLRDAIGASGGREVKHEGDGFFAVFDDPESALDCAVAVQQRLSRHRKEHGFSPRVRIGLHCGGATERDGDYFGMAVNTTARVMSLAGGEEILATSEMAPESRRSGPPREVRLKGVSDPVSVVEIGWD